MSDALWVCDDCGMVGSRAEVESHGARHAHDVGMLDEDTSRLVLDDWRYFSNPRVVTAHALAAEIARVGLGRDVR